MFLRISPIIMATSLLVVAQPSAASSNCDSFEQAARTAMATKLSGSMLPGHDDIMINEMHASTSVWLIHKGSRSEASIIDDFASEWQHACAAGTYGTRGEHD